MRLRAKFNMEIKLSSVEDALSLSQYYVKNEAHLSLWEPLKGKKDNNLALWQERLKQRELEQSEKKAAYFLAYNEGSTEIIATCNLTGISYGVFMACYMGYSVSRQFEGQGFMKKLCSYVTQYAFNDLGLNRVMSNYMPNNLRSENLLVSMGFVKEGLAKNYLYINGKWEDHILTSLVNDENTYNKN